MQQPFSLFPHPSRCHAQRFAPWLRNLLIAFALLVLPASVTAAPIHEENGPAATIVNANITADTTWTLANSPYSVTTAVTVVEGVTLTVEPGVVVRMSQSTELEINGRLHAVGTAAQPITFTTTTPEKGWWYGLSFTGTADAPLTGSKLAYVTVEYAGRSSYGNLNLLHAAVEVSHSTIRNSSANGIRGLTSGVAHISDSTFTGNDGYPIEFSDGSVDPQMANLSISGNSTDAIAFGGGVLNGERTWRALGVPYIFGTMTVPVGATLTVEPGVEARFRQAAELDVNGKLLAMGTAAQPIILTTTTAEKGWWYGLSFNGTVDAPLTGSKLAYVTVEYAGRSSYGNLNLLHAVVEVSHSTIRNSSANGIRGLTSGVAHISDSTFTGNGDYPIEFSDGSVDPQLANLSISGNSTDAIAFGGGVLNGERTWRALGVPYIFGTMTVPADATLTVEPGVEARFGQAAELEVNGRLVAIGTAANPIFFTTTTPQAGWWYGLSFNGTVDAPLTGSKLAYVTVEYAGRSSYGNLNLLHAAVEVSHSTIRNSSANGIRGMTNGVAHIRHSTFTGNGDYPIEFSDGSVDPQLANLSISGNSTDAIAIGGGVLDGERTWRALGVPYIFGTMTVPADATLTVEPGVEARFGQAAELEVNGRLIAIGFADRPIVFTATTPEPGWWYGIGINGSTQASATAEFDHVTVEYSGRSSYANLNILRGQVTVKHSMLRHSASHGIAVAGNSVVTVEASQLVENAEYGIRNSSGDQSDVVVAANNWWGSSSGPTADGECNPGGTGSRVSEGVAFRPFLTAVDQEPAPLLPADARILTITPRRWFVPADGVTRAFVTLTLHDGNGRPLPGRTVQLGSTLGSVTDGGVTDVQGETLAYIKSSTAGDAHLTANLDATACETARSATAKITFTDAAADALFPDGEAPYFHSTITIDPEPIVRGVPTRLSAELTNPNDYPITVDATFGYVQASIGLAFGPVGEVTGQVIPAKSTREISLVWTPTVSGHYCIELTYTAQRADAVASDATAVMQSGRAQRNLNVYPGPLGSPNEKDSLQKADNAFKLISKAPAGKATQVHKFILSKWWGWMKETASEISKNLGSDPPRQDYRTLATVEERLTLPPVVSDAEISPARAAAINGVTEALLDAQAYGLAATVSLDRYGGAAAANDLQWMSLQGAALLHYKQEMARALLVAADRIDALRALAISEGTATIPITADEFRAYQQELATNGFTAQEIADAKQAGLRDDQIEAHKQELLHADPETVAGDLLTYLAEWAAAYRALGNAILYPPMPNFSVGGSSGLVAAETAPDQLARVFNTVSTIQVGNPLDHTATVELQIRRIDLPADWMVTVTPLTATLAPGEQITATVTVLPGSSAVQGTVPRVAVEGYAGEELLGGVAIDVIVPEYAFFDGQMRLYLPLIQR